MRRPTYNLVKEAHEYRQREVNMKETRFGAELTMRSEDVKGYGYFEQQKVIDECFRLMLEEYKCTKHFDLMGMKTAFEITHKRKGMYTVIRCELTVVESDVVSRRGMI